MAKATITIDDKVDGSIGILLEIDNPENQESGADLIARTVMDMLANLLQMMKEHAELPEVPSEDGRI